MKTSLRFSISLATFVSCLYFFPTASAQHVSSNLIIEAKETYIVGPDNILKVDTLIMQDKATIQFAPNKYGVLEAKVAIIGDKCMILSKGAEGKKAKNFSSGEDGQNGGNLSITLNFEVLGELTIDNRGGDGGRGADGVNGKAGKPDRLETQTYVDASGRKQTLTLTVPGEAGTDGSDATRGGNGGHGGNLLFMYNTNGFIPVFNHSERKINSIIILSSAGQRGPNGKPGKGGFNAVDGNIRDYGLRDSSIGRIELINLSLKAY